MQRASVLGLQLHRALERRQRAGEVVELVERFAEVVPGHPPAGIALDTDAQPSGRLSPQPLARQHHAERAQRVHVVGRDAQDVLEVVLRSDEIAHPDV